MSRRITPEVGYRLASLADGEGCFSISRRLRKPRGRGIYDRAITPDYHRLFTVQMRADDEPFLRRMQEATGLGLIYVSQERPELNPRVRWAVQRIAECRSLVVIFDQYPLWSKKAADYAVWRQAVLAPGGAPALERWFNEIRELRRYAA